MNVKTKFSKSTTVISALFVLVLVYYFIYSTFVDIKPVSDYENENLEQYRGCPDYVYPEVLAKTLIPVQMNSTDFEPEECLARVNGTLLIGYPETTAWEPVTLEGLKGVNAPFYFLRCVVGEEVFKDTVRVFPKLSNPIPAPKEVKGVSNIVVLLVDAVSRERFKASYLKTKSAIDNYLSKPDSTHFGTIFGRYHANGRNSAENQIAMFTPHSVYEYAEMNETDFIWNKAMDNGYITSHIDWNCIGRFSQNWYFEKKREEECFSGLAVPARDMNVMPTEKIDTADLSLYPRGSMTYMYGSRFGKDIGYQYRYPNQLFCDQFERNLKLTCDASAPVDIIHSQTFAGLIPICIGSRTTHDMTFQYMRDILEMHANEKNFMTSIFLETHQDKWLLESFDADLAKYIEGLIQKDPDVAIFLMSDHGLHYGDEFDHTLGNIHSKLPLFYPILPKSLPTEMKENLMYNSKKMVTHHDFFETLRHLMDLEGYVAPIRNYNRGISLLNSRVTNRPCSELAIPPHVCLCFYE